MTEGNGLPLAFLVRVANVAEVTVGLKVVDQVRVPQPQGRPKQRPTSLGADQSDDGQQRKRIEDTQRYVRRSVGHVVGRRRE